MNNANLRIGLSSSGRSRRTAIITPAEMTLISRFFCFLFIANAVR